MLVRVAVLGAENVSAAASEAGEPNLLPTRVTAVLVLLRRPAGCRGSHRDRLGVWLARDASDLGLGLGHDNRGSRRGGGQAGERAAKGGVRDLLDLMGEGVEDWLFWLAFWHALKHEEHMFKFAGFPKNSLHLTQSCGCMDSTAFSWFPEWSVIFAYGLGFWRSTKESVRGWLLLCDREESAEPRASKEAVVAFLARKKPPKKIRSGACLVAASRASSPLSVFCREKETVVGTRTEDKKRFRR